MTDRERLERIVAIERELARRRESSLVDRLKWFPGQDAFLRSTERFVLFRAGSNLTGKTYAGAAELIYRMRGRHPYKPVRPGPISAWVVGGGGEQLQWLQRKVWDLCPKDEVEPGCHYDVRKGKFVGRFPKLIFKNGSIAEFKAGTADASSYETGTVDYLWCDEPPEDERTFEELLKRLRQRNGDGRLTLTPADLSRPLDWLRTRTHSVKGRPPQIIDLHYPLTAENMIYVGTDEIHCLSDGTPCDQKWVDEMRAATPAYEAGVSLDGDWNYKVEGNYFDVAWNPAVHIRSRPDLEDRKDLLFLLGGDHGNRPGKECAYLMSAEEMFDGGWAIHVWDEYVDVAGTATPLQDAVGWKAMLDRNGLPTWDKLTEAFADRPHQQGRGSQKSNMDLSVHLCRLYGLTPGKLRPILKTVKQGEGGAESPWAGVRWLHDRMMERDERNGEQVPRFTVDPCCERLIESIPRYTGDPNEDAKDSLDAVRYGVKGIRYRRKRVPSQPYYVR